MAARWRHPVYRGFRPIENQGLHIPQIVGIPRSSDGAFNTGDIQFHADVAAICQMMKLNIKVTDEGMSFDDFPDAAKCIQFSDPKLRRFRDLWLHHLDFEFAISCLDDIASGEPIKATTMQALWHTALVQYYKCFSSSKTNARSGLDAKQIFKSTLHALRVHRQLKFLRDKHIVHDESAFRSVSVGAILNKDGSSGKIAKIVCVAALGDTLTSQTWTNLRILVTTANSWVLAKFDELGDEMMPELESKDYAELFALPEAKMHRVKWDDMAKVT